MIAIDSNVLHRYPDKRRRGANENRKTCNYTLTADEPGYVPIVVLAEITWVLKRTYKASRKEIGDAVEALLVSSELIFDQRDIAVLALETYRQTGADFADALIVHAARKAGCSETVTFDRSAATQAGMSLLK